MTFCDACGKPIEHCDCAGPRGIVMLRGLDAWLPTEDCKEPFFGIDRTKEAFILSDKYIPAKRGFFERLRDAWAAFKYGRF